MGIEYMPWGKWKGYPIEEVPHDYMRWAVRNADAMSDELRAAMEKILELAPGSTGKSRLMALERENESLKKRLEFSRGETERILKQSYGEMSRRFHPDAGGSNESQIVVNLIFEDIRQKFRKN